MPSKPTVAFAIVLMSFVPATSNADEPPAPPPPPTTSGATAPTAAESPTSSRFVRCSDPDAEGEVRLSTGCSGVFGIRGAVTNVRGATSGAGPGLMVSQEGEAFSRNRFVSTRGFHRLGIGGGGGGFEGALLGGVAGGIRVPFGERHGPVVRAGLEGYLLGNDAFYASLLELPQLQLGYQYMRGTTVFEIGAKTGIVLTGRWRGGDSQARHLGGAEAGAYLAVQVPWVRVGASATRLPTDDRLQSSVDVAQGTLCFMSTPVAICADARAMRADAINAAGGVSHVQAFYGGLALGLTRER